MFRGKDVEQVNELKREGLSIRAIGGCTGYDRKTIRRQRPSAQPARAIATGVSSAARPPSTSSNTSSLPGDREDHGGCRGYVIDHVVPLKRGGADAPSNMLWQTNAEAKAKDKVE